MQALQDYIEHERGDDAGHWHKCPAFFLASTSSVKSGGRLSTVTVNRIWNEATTRAGTPKGKTPHSARHAMGVHLIKKTANPSAVQRQLGHNNGGYSMQYMRISDKELKDVLDER